MPEKHTTQCFGKELCIAIAGRVIGQLQMNTNDIQSGDGKLSNLWDEICVQVQGGPFFFWESHLDETRELIRGEVVRLREYERHGLWIYLMEWMHVNGRSVAVLDDSVAIDHILDQYLLPEAAKCRNPRIVTFLGKGCERL